MRVEDILHSCDELGISYELNSSSPGIFIVDKNGVEREATFEDLFNPPI